MPAQIARISKFAGGMTNKEVVYVNLDRLDSILSKTPLNFVSQSYSIISKKL